MVSAAYVVRPGRCALGPLGGEEEELARMAAGEAPAPEELFVLELHRGEPPRLRRTRSVDEIGICLEHWGQAVQGIGDAILELVAQEDPAAAQELARRRDYVAAEVEDVLDGEAIDASLEDVRLLAKLPPAPGPEKPHRVPRRRSFPMT